MSLSEVQDKEAKLCFKLYDSEGSGTLPSTEIGKLLRSLGATPGLFDIRRIQESIDGDVFTVEQLKDIYANNLAPPPDLSVIVEALAKFDVRKTGQLTVEELKLALTSLGERLTEEEADQIMKASDKEGTGHVNLETFAAYLCGDDI